MDVNRSFSVDKTLRKVTSIEDQKAEDYRYWQSVSGGDRMSATWEMSFEAYKLKGLAHDGQRLQRTFVRIQQPQR
jgi:hypothetical protein